MRIVAFVQEPLTNAGSRYRIDKLAPQLREHGVHLVTCSPMNDRLALGLRRVPALGTALYYLVYLLKRLCDLPKALRADAVIVFRGMYPLGPPVFERLLFAFGKRVIYDFDDALWIRPPFANRGYRWVDLGRVRKILRRAAWAVVGCEYLARYARRFCPRVTVIPTCIDTERYTARPQPLAETRPLVVGWVGVKSGFRYLHQLDSVWRDLQKRHGIVFRVVSNGRYEAPGLAVDNVTWTEEREIADLHSLDIGIMPLEDGEFERGKAAFKLIQYMAVGLATVASPVGMNREVLGDGERGLAAATPGEWRRQLERLITDAELRQTLGRAARAHVIATYSTHRAVSQWLEILQSLTGDQILTSPRGAT